MHSEKENPSWLLCVTRLPHSTRKPPLWVMGNGGLSCFTGSVDGTLGSFPPGIILQQPFLMAWCFSGTLLSNQRICWICLKINPWVEAFPDAVCFSAQIWSKRAFFFLPPCRCTKGWTSSPTKWAQRSVPSADITWSALWTRWWAATQWWTSGTKPFPWYPSLERCWSTETPSGLLFNYRNTVGGGAYWLMLEFLCVENLLCSGFGCCRCCPKNDKRTHSIMRTNGVAVLRWSGCFALIVETNVCSAGRTQYGQK